MMNGNNQSRIAQKPDYVVCTCMGVMYSEILEAIERGANTLDDLSDLLAIGTGCTSCVPEVIDIIAQVAVARERSKNQ